MLTLALIVGLCGASNSLLSVFVPKTVSPPPQIRQIPLTEYHSWQSFQHGPENPQTPFARYQITTTSPTLLLMTSYVLPGASFSYQLNGALLQNTSMPTSSTKNVQPMLDPQEAFQSAMFSHATLVLDIGPHALDVRVGRSPYENGLMALKLVHLPISPIYHADYFLVNMVVPVHLANRTCQAFSSHLVHLPSQKELSQVMQTFGGEQVFYIGGYEEVEYDGSPLVVVPGKNGLTKVTKDIWKNEKAMVLCHRRYPPQQKQ